MAKAPTSRRAQHAAALDLDVDIDIEADASEDGASQLLSVALTVDQLDGGEFHWVIIESFDHSMEFEQLAASVIGYGTYSEALEAGFEVFKGMSPDPRLGPRDLDDRGDEHSDER